MKKYCLIHRDMELYLFFPAIPPLDGVDSTQFALGASSFSTLPTVPEYNAS